MESDERVIAHLKSNFAEIGPSQIFRLNKSEGFQWTGESDITPDEIVSFNAKKSNAAMNRLEEAIEFLTDLLSEEGEVPAVEAIELAEDV